MKEKKSTTVPRITPVCSAGGSWSEASTASTSEASPASATATPAAAAV